MMFWKFGREREGELATEGIAEEEVRSEVGCKRRIGYLMQTKVPGLMMRSRLSSPEIRK